MPDFVAPSEITKRQMYFTWRRIADVLGVQYLRKMTEHHTADSLYSPSRSEAQIFPEDELMADFLGQFLQVKNRTEAKKKAAFSPSPKRTAAVIGGTDVDTQRKVGEHVCVRDGDDKEWRFGIIEHVGLGANTVRLDGPESDFVCLESQWKQVRVAPAWIRPRCRINSDWLRKRLALQYCDASDLMSALVEEGYLTLGVATFEIQAILLGGERKTLTIDTSTTLDEVKQRLEEAFGIPTQHQQLFKFPAFGVGLSQRLFMKLPEQLCLRVMRFLSPAEEAFACKELILNLDGDYRFERPCEVVVGVDEDGTNLVMEGVDSSKFERCMGVYERVTSKEFQFGGHHRGGRKLWRSLRDPTRFIFHDKCFIDSSMVCLDSREVWAVGTMEADPGQDYFARTVEMYFEDYFTDSARESASVLDFYDAWNGGEGGRSPCACLWKTPASARTPCTLPLTGVQVRRCTVAEKIASACYKIAQERKREERRELSAAHAAQVIIIGITKWHPSGCSPPEHTTSDRASRNGTCERLQCLPAGTVHAPGEAALTALTQDRIRGCMGEYTLSLGRQWDGGIRTQLVWARSRVHFQSDRSGPTVYATAEDAAKDCDRCFSKTERTCILFRVPYRAAQSANMYPAVAAALGFRGPHPNAGVPTRCWVLKEVVHRTRFREKSARQCHTGPESTSARDLHSFTNELPLVDDTRVRSLLKVWSDALSPDQIEDDAAWELCSGHEEYAGAIDEANTMCPRPMLYLSTACGSL
jgi:hypothetical protein